MSVRKANHANEGVYFVTFTCANWLPLFQMVDGYKYVSKWFDYLQSQNHCILGYVIMPNHVHCIIAMRNSGKPLNTIVGNGKRFMAYALVSELKSKGLENILLQLVNGVNNTQKAMGKKHEVFEPSFDWKECGRLDVLQQKLDYIHWNPCKGEMPLVANPQDYLHSSASYYLTGKHAEYEVTDYMKILDMDLTKEN